MEERWRSAYEEVTYQSARARHFPGEVGEIGRTLILQGRSVDSQADWGTGWTPLNRAHGLGWRGEDA